MLLLATPAGLMAYTPGAGRWARPTSLIAPRATASQLKVASLNDKEIFESTTYYQDELCDVTSDTCQDPGSEAFLLAIIGDLHLDPRKMEDYEVGRSHFEPIIQDAKKAGISTTVVSLGDLGESKSVYPDRTDELFAGTTECHELANQFLSSFGAPYEVIGGNHDLEGIDEFATDEANLDAFLRIHNKPTPYFKTQVAEKTLIVGLGSTVFRDAKYTSHEVTIDDVQLAWFESMLEEHPAEDGWKIFMFSHAPPIGSGLRVLQENHVVNGCCWLNHSGGKTTRKFIELVRKHRCIKAWFSGHFHLGQDYQDSITFPTIPKEQGAYPNRGSCVFAQTSVMRSGTSRDTRQQSRLLRGNKEGFEICTVNHADGGSIRLDATITYSDATHEVGVYAHEHDDYIHDQFTKVYSPAEGDENYVPPSADDELRIDASRGEAVDMDTIAWWKMHSGRVIGIYDGRLIEYDPSTLAPLGLITGADELIGKKIVVVASGVQQECIIGSVEAGMEGADCADFEGEEQSMMLACDVEGTLTVIQPNEDGSFWRKIVRNKMIRMKENRREEAAARYAADEMSMTMRSDTASLKLVSSWGPYTSMVGTAKTTGVKSHEENAKEVSKLLK